MNKHQLEWAREFVRQSRYWEGGEDTEDAMIELLKQAQAIIADAETPDSQTIEAEYSLKYWTYVDDGKTIKIIFKGAE
jgi:hypothetical protein